MRELLAEIPKPPKRTTRGLSYGLQAAFAPPSRYLCQQILVRGDLQLWQVGLPGLATYGAPPSIVYRGAARIMFTDSSYNFVLGLTFILELTCCYTSMLWAIGDRCSLYLWAKVRCLGRWMVGSECRPVLSRATVGRSLFNTWDDLYELKGVDHKE